MLRPISARLALITGASSGLGLAIAQRLAAQHIPLALVGRNREALDAAAKGFAVPTRLFAIDLSIPEQRKELIAYIREEAPDLVFNNAGFGLYGPALAHPVQEHLDMIELNINALVAITLESAIALRKRGQRGAIANISSAAAFFPFPTFATYAATKGFVKQFSMALDEELRGTKIRILTICPGSIKTRFRLRASKGKATAPPAMAMAPEKAADLVLHQVAKRKSLSVIDWRYKIFIFLSRFVSLFLLMHLLRWVLRLFTK